MSGQTNGVTQTVRVYSQNTAVVLTAPPSAGSNPFSGWSGCDSALGTTCNVTMSADRVVTTAYTTAASPASISLSYDGQLRDRVGQCEFCRNPDGSADGTFTITLNPGSGNRTVSGIRLSNVAGGVWNTLAPDGFWTLGVASGLDTSLLNGGNDAVSFPLAEGSSFKVFAADFNNAMFAGGNLFAATVTFADGSSAAANAAIAGSALASVSLTYAGTLRDRVGQCDLCRNTDGKPDGTFTVTLNAGSGNRTVTRLHMTNTPGGVWNTRSSDGFWTLGAASGLDAPLLNGTDDSVSFSLSEGSSFQIFAADSQNIMFTAGTVFTLAVTFADGTTANASVTISAAPDVSTLTMQYDGQIRNPSVSANDVLSPTVSWMEHFESHSTREAAAGSFRVFN